MPGRILIIDSVATNRIVMKVKMQAAQFRVDSCARVDQATALMHDQRPDLILINMCDQVADLHAFCHTLKQTPATEGIAIIAMGVADTAKARLAALDAGANDVLPRPINDALLLARIRSLLRVRSAHQELVLRDGTSRALGFEEAVSPFETAANVALLSADGMPDAFLVRSLSQNHTHLVRALDPDKALRGGGIRPSPDLFVIDAGATDTTDPRLFGLVSDLRARQETGLATQLVVIPMGTPNTAAMFLDLGADDVIIGPVSGDEIALRARVLVQRKLQHDQLRATLRDGLQAAVTDQLTGLYNRRYVASHLPRIAETSLAAGASLAIMMVDIDHFKGINDTYGHAAGDMVLKQIAQRMRDSLRSIDMVARIGGEEFLVAQPRTTAAQARVTANRLRQLVSKTPFDIGEAHPPLSVCISVGVAVSHALAKTATDTIKMCARADAALYAAKSAGRNQVAMSKSAA